MGYHYQLAVGVSEAPVDNGGFHPVGHLLEGFGRERHVPRVFEVGRYFSGEVIVQLFPTATSPTHRQTELDEIVDDLDLDPVWGRDRQCRLDRPGEGR